ncbi:RNA-binding protein Rsf1-like [Neocloeon triangulifer]|uniref:RNA-binding protein Rsf1-like n=1 Tax=Neocloeon triangulifer TaxID=2078957 RepID=UPI00286F246F|nr:RNA-binding protein Rsf1-like [Neocloeon triangulifer]XP_059476912.1 RNA-binding protein Rsf1-like [Neocloeon triangulifer]
MERGGRGGGGGGRNFGGTRVYVGGLNDSVKKEEIEREFEKFGTLNHVWVAFNPPGFAFITFENEDEAQTAVEHLNGSERFGTKLRVEVSRSRGRGGRGGGGGFRGGGGGGGRREFGGGRGGGRSDFGGRPYERFGGRDDFRGPRQRSRSPPGRSDYYESSSNYRSRDQYAGDAPRSYPSHGGANRY